jgi:hypothetical protein
MHHLSLPRLAVDTRNSTLLVSEKEFPPAWEMLTAECPGGRGNSQDLENIWGFPYAMLGSNGNYISLILDSCYK